MEKIIENGLTQACECLYNARPIIGRGMGWRGLWLFEGKWLIFHRISGFGRI